eukprot:434312_1
MHLQTPNHPNAKLKIKCKQPHLNLQSISNLKMKNSAKLNPQNIIKQKQDRRNKRATKCAQMRRKRRRSRAKKPAQMRRRPSKKTSTNEKEKKKKRRKNSHHKKDIAIAKKRLSKRLSLSGNHPLIDTKDINMIALQAIPDESSTQPNEPIADESTGAQPVSESQVLKQDDGSFHARAFYDYTPADTGELNMRQGAVYKILKSADQWWFAEDDYGDVGWVPSNFLEKIVEHVQVQESKENEAQNEQEQETHVDEGANNTNDGETIQIELDEYKAKNERLEKEVKALKDEIEVLNGTQRDYDHLKQENERLSNELKQMQEANDALKNELAEQKLERQQHEERVRAKSAHVQTASAPHLDAENIQNRMRSTGSSPNLGLNSDLKQRWNQQQIMYQQQEQYRLQQQQHAQWLEYQRQQAYQQQLRQM